LIESGAKDELTSHYIIKLNRQLIRLYSQLVAGFSSQVKLS
jgi:hypothetical protein